MVHLIELGSAQDGRHAAPRQRGLSLVELLVGLAVGLFVVAAGATLLATQLRDQRGLAVENRLMQDLRTAADVIARDLRRAGHWGAAASGVWASGASGVLRNPYSTLTQGSTALEGVGFSYSRDVTENHRVDSNEQFGLRLRSGVVELQLGAGNWQALTDAGVLKFTGLSITPTSQQISLASHCPTSCPPSSSDTSLCTPHQQVRSVDLVLVGPCRAQSAQHGSASQRCRHWRLPRLRPV
jgi:type IV pilus assembly protein PilW